MGRRGRVAETVRAGAVYVTVFFLALNWIPEIVLMIKRRFMPETIPESVMLGEETYLATTAVMTCVHALTVAVDRARLPWLQGALSTAGAAVSGAAMLLAAAPVSIQIPQLVRIPLLVVLFGIAPTLLLRHRIAKRSALISPIVE